MHLSSASPRGGTPGWYGGIRGLYGDFATNFCPCGGGNVGTLSFEYPTLRKNVGTSLLFNWEEIRKDRLFARSTASLAYGWRAGNLNWPIRIQRAGKKSSVLKSSKQVREGFEIRQLFSLKMALNIHEKGFTISKTIPVCKKWKNVNHFVFPSFYFGAKNGWQAFGMVACW